MEYLRKFAQEGKVVTQQDIASFFKEMKVCTSGRSSFDHQRNHADKLFQAANAKKRKVEIHKFCR